MNFYILLEFSDCGYLLYEEENLIQTDNVKIMFQKYVELLIDRKNEKIPNDLIIAELEPKQEYPIFLQDSLISVFSTCSMRFFPLSDFTLYLLEVKEKITDFTNLGRIIDEPSITSGIMNITDYITGEIEDTAFDIFLN